MNNKVVKSGHLFTFLCLYIAQSIPMSFFSTILPVMMREHNISLSSIGLLNLIKLPWIIKFLWAPGIDRSSFKLRDFKCWIFSSELIYAAIIFSVSFLDLSTSINTIIGLIVCAFIASATQDIATDSLAVVSFSKEDRSLANSMQSIGSFAGAMIGGGLMLLLYHQFGWGRLLPYLAIFVLIAIIPLFFFRRKDNNTIIKPKQEEKPRPDDLFGFFKQKGIWKQIIFLFLYNAGIIGILAMLKPLLVDYGYNIKEIGIMSGIIGTSVGCITSFLAGFIVKKIGRSLSRIVFSGFILLTITYFILLVTFLQINTSTLHIAVCLLWGSYGFASIIIYTTSMDCVRKGYEGTDFTIQTVITHLSGIIVGVSSGMIAQHIQYKGLFIVEFCIALISFIYIISIFGFKNKTNDESRIIEEI